METMPAVDDARFTDNHISWELLKQNPRLSDALKHIQEQESLINKLRKVVKELLPYALESSQQGVAIGLPPEGNEYCKECDQTCSECVWYIESVEFMRRYDAGEFFL